MGILKPFGRLFAALCRGMDALLIAASLWLVSALLERDWSQMHTVAVFAAAGLFLVAGEFGRLYASWRLATMDEEFRNVLLAWGATCCAVIVGFFLTKTSASYSRQEMLVWFLVTPAPLVAARLVVRLVLRALRRTGRNRRSVGVIGATEIARRLVGILETQTLFGVRLAGVFDDRAEERGGTGAGDAAGRSGSFADLVERCRRGEIDYVFIALPMRAEPRIVGIVQALADTTASVYVVPDLFVSDLMRARWSSIGGLPAVSVYESPFDGLSGWVKRAEDLVLGTLLLGLAAIPMLFVAVGLKLTKAESVFFRQQRYGLNGKVVRVWKFRTMSVSEDGNDVVTVKGRSADPRVTPLGALLRATSLDELPQLFNVLSGEMSLVGPRPHAVRVNEEFRRLIHGYMLRHKVKPGITGWAQVNGWHGDDTIDKMQKRVEHDLAYVQDWSLWFDLKILVMTAIAVLARNKEA